MKFGITQEVDNKSAKKSYLVQELSSSLENFLKNKTYGTDIDTFLIGFVGIKTKSGYEGWYKERKPKYIDYRLTKSRLTGEQYEVIKQYSYDIKFDYELYDNFVDGIDDESKKILAREIIKSFKYLDKLPKKIQDFDKENFKLDVENFFREQKLL